MPRSSHRKTTIVDTDAPVTTEEQELQLVSNNRQLQSYTKSAGFFVGSAIFFDYLQRFLGGSVGSTSRYFFFPLSIAISFANTMWLYRQARQEQKMQAGKINRGTIANVAIELATSLVVAVALIGGAIAQSAVFVLATPILLLIAVGSKAIWDGLKGINSLWKAIKLEAVTRTDIEEMDRKELYKNARDNLISATMTALITISMGVVMLTTGLAIYAALGFGAALIGSAAHLYSKYNNANVSLTERPVVEPITPARTSSTAELLSSDKLGPPAKVRVLNFGEAYYSRETVLQSQTRYRTDSSHAYLTSKPKAPEASIEVLEHRDEEKTESAIISSYRPSSR
jgi:hypothetical protein